MRRCPEAVAARSRLWALAAYCGLAVLRPDGRPRESDAFIRFHYAHALACFGLLAAGLVLIVLYQIIDCLFIIYGSDWYDLLPIDQFSTILAIGWFGVFAGLPGLSAIQAMRGVSRDIPILSRMARARRLAPVARLFGGILLFSLVGFASTVWHATTIVGRNPSFARVAFLYDDLGWLPRPVFDLGIYRVALAAARKWGSHSVAVAPLTTQNLYLALQFGEVVIVASHGDFGAIYLSDREGWLTPECVQPGIAGPRLRFVYLAGCKCGHRKNAWQYAIHPAQVQTYFRNSAVLEHVYWLWTAAPRLIRGLPGSP